MLDHSYGSRLKSMLIKRKKKQKQIDALKKRRYFKRLRVVNRKSFDKVKSKNKKKRIDGSR